MKHHAKSVFYEYLIITIGSVIYSTGIALFLDPNNLAPGGVTGISIILSNYIPIETGTIIFIINIPILMLGFWKLGRKMMCRTLYCTAINSLIIDGIRMMFDGPATDDLLIAAIAGACLSGGGIGIILKKECTTGGTDIIIRLLRRKHPHIKTSALFSVIDCGVVALSAVAFGNIEIAMYALIAVVTSAAVLDKVLYGTDEAKLIYIISDNSREIADRMLKDLDLGVTFIQGRGAYSGKEKDVIMAVMRKTLAPKAEEVIKEIDPAAFMIVSSANEIYGEGYKNLFSEKL